MAPRERKMVRLDRLPDEYRRQLEAELARDEMEARLHRLLRGNHRLMLAATAVNEERAVAIFREAMGESINAQMGG